MADAYSNLINEMNGCIRWLLLEAAVRMKLFDVTEKWVTDEDISHCLGTNISKTALYLDALVSCGYLRKFCGQYRNSDLSEKYLKSGQELYQGSLLLSLGERRLKNLDNIPLFLKENGGQKLNLADENIWKNSIDTLIPFQRAVSENVADILDSLNGAESFRDVLDLGGGPCLILEEFLKRHEGINLTLLDLPPVADLAEGFSPACKYIKGSYSHIDFGGEYDLIWASRSLYYADDINNIASKAFSALKKGGYFISLHEGLYNERTEPYEVILGRVGVAMNGSDVSFSRGEIENALTGAGFKLLSVQTVTSIGGVADMITAVKI